MGNATVSLLGGMATHFIFLPFIKIELGVLSKGLTDSFNELLL